MKNRNIYSNSLIILAAVLFGWLFGYYVRWDPATKRPYIEYRNGLRATVEEVDDDTARNAQDKGLQDDEPED